MKMVTVALMTAGMLLPPMAASAAGWYLMLPPTDEIRPGGLMAGGQVAAKWRTLRAFDAAAECERSRMRTIDEVKRAAEDKSRRATLALQEKSLSMSQTELAEFLARDPLQREAIEAFAWQTITEASRCVSADDPRLR